MSTKLLVAAVLFVGLLAPGVAGAAAAAPSTIAVPCSGRSGGESGLIAAVAAADAAGRATTIVLAQGCTYRLTQMHDIPDGGGLPAVTGDVIIRAPRATPETSILRLPSAPSFSILNVDAPGHATLADVTIQGGVAPDGFVGGGIGVGPGATLTLLAARVTGNRATSTSSFLAFGGGIGNEGHVTVDHTRVDHNTATNLAPGQLAAGGGIGSDGTDPNSPATLDVRNSTIDHNTALASSGDAPGAVGGGVATLGAARATFIDSDVRDNEADAGGTGGAALGAGVFDNQSFFTGLADTATVFERGTLRDNTAFATGGGFAAGGALYAGAGDHSRITGAAVVDGNAATARGSGAAAAGGVAFVEDGATLVLDPSVVVGRNSPGGCAPSGSVPGCP